MSIDRLRRLFLAIEEEMGANPNFAKQINSALKGSLSPKSASRRNAPALDPQHVLADDGETGLRRELGKLDVDQLKDVVSAHGMDPSRLAMKWSSRERLIEHIVTTSTARAKKGDAFRA